MPADSHWRAEPPTPLDIGKVLSSAFAAFGRNGVTLLILATPLYLLPMMAFNYFLQASVNAAMVTPANFWSSLAPIMLFFIPFAIILQPLFMSSIVWTVWADESGGRPDALAAVRAALAQLLWILVAGFLIALVTGIGFLLLVVPGIMAVVAFSATLPACVVEKLGPTAAMSRSLELTRGQRWRLFGLFLVVAVLSALPGLASGIVGGAASVALPGARLAITAVTNTLGAAVGAVFGAVVSGCAYTQLRANREGLGSVNVAEVFA